MDLFNSSNMELYIEISNLIIYLSQKTKLKLVILDFQKLLLQKKC